MTNCRPSDETTAEALAVPGDEWEQAVIALRFRGRILELFLGKILLTCHLGYFFALFSSRQNSWPLFRCCYWKNLDDYYFRIGPFIAEHSSSWDWHPPYEVYKTDEYETH